MPHESGRRKTDWPTLAGWVALAIATASVLSAIADARAAAGDYVQDYLAARNLLTGRPVYHPAVPESARVPTFGPGVSVVNDHPPTYILALAPLGLLLYPTAFATLGVASVLAGGWAGWRVGREVGLGRGGRAGVAAAVLFTPGAVGCVAMGAVSLLLAAGLVAGWAAWRSGRQTAAGWWVGVATAVKLFPGLLVVGFLANRQWRAAVTTGVTVVAGWAVAAAVLTPDQVRHYLCERMPANAAEYVRHGFNMSITGAAHRTFGEPSDRSPWLGRAAVWPQAAARLGEAGQFLVLAVIGWRLFGPPADHGRRPDQAFALLVPAMLLVCPLTWLHAVPLLVGPVAILARDACRRSRWGRLAAVIACVLPMYLDTLWLAKRLIVALGEPVPWTGNLLLLLPTWGVLGLFVLAATEPPAPS